MMRLRSPALALLVLAVLAAACASTFLTDSWKDPDYRGEIRRIYLVGVANDEDKRRMFEDSFVQQLQTLGVTGLASYRDLPSIESADQNAVVDQVGRNQADAILMARVAGRRNERLMNSGYGAGGYSPVPYYQSWGSYYDRRNEDIYVPASANELQVVTIEANLYDAASGKLVWAAQLETFIEADLGTLLAGFAKTVTRDLRRQDLL